MQPAITYQPHVHRDVSDRHSSYHAIVTIQFNGHPAGALYASTALAIDSPFELQKAASKATEVATRLNALEGRSQPLGELDSPVSAVYTKTFAGDSAFRRDPLNEDDPNDIAARIAMHRQHVLDLAHAPNPLEERRQREAQRDTTGR